MADTTKPDEAITPDMIEAGVRALYEPRRWDEDPGEWIVERVYRAMELARVSPNRTVPVAEMEEAKSNG